MIQVWAECSRSLWEAEDTLMCVLSTQDQEFFCVPNEATSPTVHTQSFDVGTKQFIVPLPLEECFKNDLTFTFYHKLYDFILFQGYQGRTWAIRIPPLSSLCGPDSVPRDVFSHLVEKLC